MTYHTNARTNRYQRKRIKESKAPYRILAKQLGVSVTTIAKWKKREEMSDYSSRPKTMHKAIPETFEPVLEFLRKDWLMDMDSIWYALRATILPELKRSSVYRQLVRQGLNNIKKLQPEDKKQFKQFEACEPGFIHIDIFNLPRIDKTRCYVFIAIDRATRLMTLKTYEKADKQASVNFLKHCQNFYPFRIYKILTDNGGQFTNRFYKKESNVKRPKTHVFTQECEQSNIQHTLIKPYHPWTNGLAERTIGTLKSSVVHRMHYNKASQLSNALYGFIRFFNCDRPYKAMNGKTPVELTEIWFKKNKDIFIKDPALLFTTL